VDPGLDENHAVLGVHILAVEGEMLVDSDGLLHEVEEIFGDFRGEVY
jgi:hypothetical protein